MDPMKQITDALGAIETKATANADLLQTFHDKLTEIDKRTDRLNEYMNRPQVRGAAIEGTALQREHRDLFLRHLRKPKDQSIRAELQAAEVKTASGLTDSAGGAAVPELMLTTIQQKAKDLTAMRQIANVIRVSSGDIKFPIKQNDASSAWVGETGTRSGTTEPTLIERKPTFGTVYSYVEASEELVFDAAFDVGAWFSDSIADELALAEGNAFISGDGSNKPTGILNTAPVADLAASPAPDNKALLYLPTGGAAGFAATDPADVLVDAIYGVKAQYRNAGRFVMNSQTAKVIAKFKDADGRFLLQAALAAGMPATLLGYPVTIDEAMPDIAANAHPILFGDFRRGYVIADAGSIRVTYDDNVTSPGKVKWYVRKRVGGFIGDHNAVCAIKCATS